MLLLETHECRNNILVWTKRIKYTLTPTHSSSVDVHSLGRFPVRLDANFFFIFLCRSSRFYVACFRAATNLLVDGSLPKTELEVAPFTFTASYIFIHLREIPITISISNIPSFIAPQYHESHPHYHSHHRPPLHP